ncbi:hypothetical protein SYNPCC7002_A2794 [Picosynechococcus sp. PCC 7002]|nr:hypothetical protein SYNPCC7002_A2794 [Picosynechococcus sp. PCC 7002]
MTGWFGMIERWCFPTRNSILLFGDRLFPAYEFTEG